jgi:hypothetical protein
MHALLKQGMDSGEVAPLPWTVYGRDQCQDAFRFLASGARPAALCLQAAHAFCSTALLANCVTAATLQCTPSNSAALHIIRMHGHAHLDSNMPCLPPVIALLNRQRT